MEDLGITIGFNIDKADLDKDVDGLNKDFRLLKKEVAQFNKYLKFNPQSADALAKKIKNLQLQEQYATEILERYNKQLDELRSKGINSGDEFNATVVAIEKANNDLIGVQRQLEKAKQESENIRDIWDGASEAMGRMSKKAGELAEKTKAVSKASQGLLKTAVKGAIDYEDAFADVRKTVNITGEDAEEQYQAMSDGLRELSKRVPTTASDLAKIAGLAGQMGVQAQDIVSFTEAMVKFGDATNITAENAVTEIAQIYNVIGKGGNFSSLDNLLSTIVELGNNTATTEADIVEMFRNIAAASSRVGMTESQMAALAATLSSLGLDKGGASAISRIMTNIDKAVDSGGKSLAEWAEVAGMSAAEFQKVWGSDAAAGLLAVVEGIAKSNEEGMSFNQTLEELGIKEIRQVDTLSRLVNAHENYKNNIQMANDAYEEGNALSVEAAKRYKTIASQLKILRNNFMEFALAIGDIFMPVLQIVVDLVKDLADRFNALDPSVKQAIAKLLLVTATLSPLLTAVSKASGLLSIIFGKVGTLIGTIKNLGGVLNWLWLTLAKILAPVMGFIVAHAGLIAALVAIGVALYELYKNCETFRNIVQSVVDWVKKLWEQFMQTNWVVELGEKFGWFGEILGGIIEIIQTLLGWFGKLFERILEFLGISGSLSSALGGLSNAGRIAGQFNVLNSGGFMSSGGMMAGGITLNNTFTINNANNIDKSTVLGWADVMTERINENLGRMV